MKTQMALFFLLLNLFLMNLSFAADAPTSSAPGLPVNTVPFRFVMTADNGSLTPIDGQPNQYQLTLNNVNPYTTFYPRRPSRQTGLASVENFIKAWGIGMDSFANDNPNAVLYAASMNSQANTSNINYILQLSNPTYSVTSNTLGFVVTLLGNQRLLFNQLLLQQVILIVN